MNKTNEVLEALARASAQFDGRAQGIRDAIEFFKAQKAEIIIPDETPDVKSDKKK